MFHIFFICFSLLLSFSLEAQKAEEDEKIRLVVLDFTNLKNEANYGYLSPSISSALQGSLRKVFDYSRESNREVKKSLSKILKKEKRKLYQLTQKDIKELAREQKIDIILYGEYIPSGASDIKVKTKIYFSHSNVHFLLSNLKIKIDAYLFVVLDKIAENAVKKIKSIVEESQEVKESEGKKSKVITLRRKSIINIEKVFAERISEITEEGEQGSLYQQEALLELGGGVFYPITFFNFSTAGNSILTAGAGFNAYARTSLGTLALFIFKKEKLKIPDWLKYNLLTGFTFTSAYSFDLSSANRFAGIDVPEDQNIDYLFQHYIFSFIL